MFGRQVRWYRQRLALTQEELAARTGVHSRTIAKIENGRILAPRTSTIRLLADGFGLVDADREAFLRGVGMLPPPHPVPSQLPADVSTFVGRQPQLNELDSTLASTDWAMPAVITAICGTAGVGKTALAIHWAHRVRDQFPDGQLYVDLRGYDHEQPVSTQDALAAFLRALGMRPGDVPVDPAECAASYRSLLDGRRLLLVLDNASSVEHVQLLLPGAASVYALVTSRDSLGGLVARHGAHRIGLGLLPLPDSRRLLRSLIGVRVDEDEPAADALTEYCAGLPLALRVTAELAANRPGIPLATLSAELADRHERLRSLDAGGDPRTALSAVFSWSYDCLPPEDAQMFQRVGLHPGADIDIHAAAAIGEVTPRQAQQTLDRLARAHLIHRTAPHRYGMHDLLRSYATMVASTVEPQVDRRSILRRLGRHYVDTASAAVAVAQLDERQQPFAIDTERFDGPESAQTWLADELDNLMAVATAAAADGDGNVALVLSSLLRRFLIRRGLHNIGVTIHTTALQVARSVGDRAAEAGALTRLGATYGQWGEHADARRTLEPAVELARSAGDPFVEASAARNLAVAHWLLGDPDKATALSTRALDAARSAGDGPGEAHALANRGLFFHRLGRADDAIRDLTHAIALYEGAPEPSRHDDERAMALATLCDVHRRQGRLKQASDCAERALAIAMAGNNHASQGVALRDLGAVRLHQGNCDEAAAYLLRAIGLLRAAYPYAEARAICYLGDVRHLERRHAEAIALHKQALAHFRHTSSPGDEAVAMIGLGRTWLALGEPGAALDLFGSALAKSHQIGWRNETAAAHAGLGHAHAALGDLDTATRQWELSLTDYRDLGAPEADDIQTLLSDRPPITNRNTR